LTIQILGFFYFKIKFLVGARTAIFLFFESYFLDKIHNYIDLIQYYKNIFVLKRNI